jgi:hypothetical protein
VHGIFLIMTKKGDVIAKKVLEGEIVIIYLDNPLTSELVEL